MTHIQPGVTIEHRLTYTNTLGEDISNLVPMLPIPQDIQYLDGTDSTVTYQVQIETKYV